MHKNVNPGLKWKQDSDGDWMLFYRGDYVGLVGQNRDKTEFGVFYGLSPTPLATGTAAECKKRLVEIFTKDDCYVKN